MNQRPSSILFLCTGNSARSILAEYLLRSMAPDRFETHSAGSDPQGTVHPLALRILRQDYDLDATDARSKSWDELREMDFDFVVTVCDHARETCPVWPGSPIIAHWGMPDPAAVEGSEDERLAAFRTTARKLHQRLEQLCELPLEKLDRGDLELQARAIGRV